MEHAHDEPGSGGTTRRQFLFRSTLAGIGMSLAPWLGRGEELAADDVPVPDADHHKISLNINGQTYPLTVDSRVTLLDALREKLGLTGTKKGCDHGQCGACTVLAGDRRINSCMTLAVMCEGKHITTIEGLAKGEDLHPLQQAFIVHDAFQCGYCTPGQICSAVGLLKEGHAHTEQDVRELMSGNICRCGAYQNIVEAILSVQNG